jgi:phage host-nuclease inhibitor protein Gam
MADENAVVNNSAQFTEVLEIRADSRTFIKNLREIEAEWDRFQQKLGGKGNAGKALDTSNTAKLSSQVQELTKVVKAFAEGTATVQKALADTVIESINKIEQADKRAAAAVAKSAKQSADEVAKSAKIAEGAVNTSGEKITNRLQNYRQRIAQLHARFLAGEEHSETTAAARINTAQAKLNQDFIQTMQKRDLELAKMRGKRLAEEAKSTKIDSSSVSSRFIGTLTKDLPELIAYTIRFSLAFRAFGLILDGASKLASGFFSIFSDGVKYLDQLQEKSSDIREALVDNVKFSGDLTTNYKLASQAADILTRKTEDYAARLGVAADVLQKGLQTLIQSGGARFVSHTDDLAKLNADIAGILRASGVQVSTRRLTTEIQELLQGTIKPSSKLLEVMGLTQAQAKQIVQHAKEHHDLLPQIESRAKGVLDRVATADDRYKDLSEQVELIKNRWEGLVAGPVFTRMIQFLKDIKTWLDTHKDLVDKLGLALGNVVKHAVDLVDQLLQSGNALPGMVVFAGKFASYMEGAADAVATTVSLFNSFKDNPYKIDGGQVNRGVPLTPEQLDPQRAQKEAAFDAEQESRRRLIVGQFSLNAGQREADRAALNQLLADFRSGKFTQGHTGPSAPDYTGTNDKPHADEVSALRKVEEAFREELRMTELAYQRLRNASAESVAARTKSHKDAAKEISGSYDKEYAAVDKLVKKYTGMAKSTGAKPDQIFGVTSGMTKALDELVANQENATTQAQKAANAETAEIQQAHFKALLQMQQEHAHAELDLEHDRLEQGLLSEAQFVRSRQDLERADHVRRLVILQDEINRTADGTKEHAAALDERAREDQHYTDLLKRQAIERITIAQREQAQADNYNQQMRQGRLDRESRQLQSQANQGLIAPDFAAQAQITLLQRQIAEFQKQISELSRMSGSQLKAHGINDEHERDLKVAGLQAAIDELAGHIREAVTRNPLSRTIQGVIATFKLLKDSAARTALGLSKFDVIANGIETFAQNLQGIIAAFKEGGVGGGLSAIGGAFKNVGKDLKDNIGGITKGLSDTLGKGFGGALGGMLGKLGSAAGPIGSILSIAGSVFSIFSGLFTRAARRIGEEIRKSIGDIMKHYQRGDTTLVDTIKELEAKKDEAIRRLSGKKGGKKELDKILPDLDDKIFDLQQKQKEIVENFDNQFLALKVHSEELSGFVQKWQDINKLVKDYIGAGGDAAKANQFLSMSLQKLRQDAAVSLAEGEQEAIQDVIQLNDLLEQRTQLIDDFKKKEFDLLYGDAIERRQSSAIAAGRELDAARKKFQEDLDKINQEINLQTLKADKERELFGLSTDIATLHRRDEELAVIALDVQIDKWRALRAIVDGVGRNADGSFGLMDWFQKLINGQLSLTDALPNIVGAANYNNASTLIVGDITVNAAPGANGREIGGGILAAIDRRRRYGLDPYYD